MPKTLINLEIHPTESGCETLKISELFTEVLQGEGLYTGHPATFLRLSGCPLGCEFCDSTKIWKESQSFCLDEILSIMAINGVIGRLINGEHLVITGGSPLMQQKSIIKFLQLFKVKFGFLPFVEIENEAVIRPLPALVEMVSCWNNSPKLDNSEVVSGKRYKPEVLGLMSELNNSWFKFVVSSEEDWKEIVKDFIEPELIRRDQIILMPMGYCREELDKNRLMVAEMAMRENVKYSDRLQIILYNTRTGV